uniref:Protein kinase domain-containing protein n=1 Tax=Syphacia muris TaxID=451379 RepID=A0A0N5AZ72_9BILA
MTQTADDSLCWDTCNGLAEAVSISSPVNFTYSFTAASALNIAWNSIDGNLFYVQYSNISDFDNDFADYLTTNYTLLNWTAKYGTFCDQQYFRIYAIVPGGVSGAATLSVPSPSPQLKNATLELISLRYLDQPYRVSFHESNASLEIIFQYHETEWPLGDDDLEVIPMFHMINCDIPDLSSAIPQPTFEQGSQPRSLKTIVGADLMFRKCQFVYYVSEVRSHTCVNAPSIQNPDSSSMKSIRIDCSVVKDAPCEPHVKSNQPPLCGLFDHFGYRVLNKNINAKDPSTNVTVNVTFRSTLSPNKKPLYYVAFYGDAKNFPHVIETDLFGVDLINVTGNSTNCPRFHQNGTCAVSPNTVNGSIIITDLRMDKLYGVTICAVMDPTNLNFPVLTNQEQNSKSKASKIFIESKLYQKSHAVEIIVGVLASVTVFSFVMIVVFYCFYRKKSRAEKFAKMKVAQLEREQEKRYTDLPKKQDVWELERRNLILYDDKKLGSGAFGAVYMGKLIGIARGHKDAQSTLGINLMRAENCDVAVKMLPEYADALSKSEFLREIALMKTLGYHERLVNMLACITETEPYCLIVEYCSDGDLLHFLRERCNYMLKLTDVGIDYDNPGASEDVDYEMIITLKQLLMFAVQISFGLEYLSQKGFVHRDVAARNVLVHDKVNAKIGDFGLCRYIYAESSNYKAKGGRLPVKWMSPEAIKFYEFTTKSDVWSFGILMFEIITLGGVPYPGIQPDDIMEYLENGGRMEKPDNCPDDFYEVMKSCWYDNPQSRPEFGLIRQKLGELLEEVTDEYSYLKLDSQRDYYNVTYGEVPVRSLISNSEKFQIFLITLMQFICFKQIFFQSH